MISAAEGFVPEDASTIAAGGMTLDDASAIATGRLPLQSVLARGGEGSAPENGRTCSVGLQASRKGMIHSAVPLSAWNSSWLSPVDS